MFKLTAPIACLVFVASLAAGQPVSENEGVMDNVRYGDITRLDYFEADHKQVYGQDDPSLQYGLLWLPREPVAGAKTPLIVFIHGGCWLSAYDIQHSNPLASALADAGYAVWSLEYRRTGDAGGGWPGSFEDVLQGVAHAKTLANYPVDLDRMVIIGHSAGGHLALLAGGRLPYVKAVIGLAAITDVVSYSRGANSCQQATTKFFGGDYESRADAYDQANPAGRPLHANSVLLQGDLDAIVPPQQAQLDGASIKMLEGAGHFDWLHPGTRAYQLLLSTLEEVLK